MEVLSITKDNFESILSGDKTILLDFYADWCGPCKMVAPIIHEIAEEREDIVVGKINVDAEIELARAFNVASIPMLAVIKGGKVVRSEVGARPKAAILEMLD